MVPVPPGGRSLVGYPVPAARVRQGVCEVVISVHRESLAVQANGRSE
jgi:hypothetical protein